MWKSLLMVVVSRFLVFLRFTLCEEAHKVAYMQYITHSITIHQCF